MVPRLGDGNFKSLQIRVFNPRLENDSPSRGRKHFVLDSSIIVVGKRLENDSPSRGRKHRQMTLIQQFLLCLENDSPSRGRKPCTCNSAKL